MTVFTNFLRSLLLTIFLSFVAPMILVGALLLLLPLMGQLPPLQGASEAMASSVRHFLSVFGSGNPWNGTLTISLTCGFVGGLFDTYAYYRYQILR